MKKYIQNGYLAVGDGHELFYETYGNPEGLPVIFLHGGPGAGCNESQKRFFDPDIFHVLFFDQRGAPKSRPAGSLEANTMAHLVEDINKLLDFMAWDKAIFFGGSWGTTLALVYAINYPNRVKSLILRAYFPGTREVIDHFFKKSGAVELFFPDAWARFISHVPESDQHRLPEYYLEKMLSKEEAIKEHYMYEWEYFGYSTLKLDFNPEVVAEILQNMDYGPSARLTPYYSINNCFLEDDFILNNVDSIKHIPTSIVHGRYDIICPPKYAYELHQAMKKSDLFLLKAGHLASEPAIEAQLIIELAKHAKL